MFWLSIRISPITAPVAASSASDGMPGVSPGGPWESGARVLAAPAVPASATAPASAASEAVFAAHTGPGKTSRTKSGAAAGRRATAQVRSNGE